MITEAKVHLTSSELGTLWMTYMSTTGTLMMIELFNEKTIDKDAQNILASYIVDGQNIRDAIINVFKDEKAVIPVGFDERDAIREAPPLFDDIFNIMNNQENYRNNQIS